MMYWKVSVLVMAGLMVVLYVASREPWCLSGFHGYIAALFILQALGGKP